MYSVTSSGTVGWSTSSGTGRFDMTSPSIGSDGTIYIGSISNDYTLYAFNSIGSIKWKYVTTGQIYSSPSIGPNGNIYISTTSAIVYSLYSTGSLQWTYAMSSYSTASSPIIGKDGMIYVSGDSLYSLYPTGSILWKALISVYPITPIIASNGLIYSGIGNNIYSVGTLLSTLSPASTPSYGLQTGSGFPKFKGNTMNTVNLNYIFTILNLFIL
jgi:hypothetical protein